VWVEKNLRPEIFWKFFPKRLRIFNRNFTRLLRIHIYAKLPFIQSPPTLTTLCRTTWGFQPVVRGPSVVRGELPRGSRATPEKLETRRILTKQKYRPYQCCRYRLQRTCINENFADMSEVWTRLSVAYLPLVQSVFDSCLDNISYLLSNDVTATSLLKILQCARLDIEHDIRVCLSRITPRLDKLCSAKQAQPSHWTERCIMNIPLVNIFGDCWIFETEIISVCAMTFRCCARNLAFSRIQVIWVHNLSKTCSGPTRSTKGWSKCA